MVLHKDRDSRTAAKRRKDKAANPIYLYVRIAKSSNVHQAGSGWSKPFFCLLGDARPLPPPRKSHASLPQLHRVAKWGRRRRRRVHHVG